MQKRRRKEATSCNVYMDSGLGALHPKCFV